MLNDHVIEIKQIHVKAHQSEVSRYWKQREVSISFQRKKNKSYRKNQNQISLKFSTALETNTIDVSLQNSKEKGFPIDILYTAMGTEWLSPYSMGTEQIYFQTSLKKLTSYIILSVSPKDAFNWRSPDV